MSGRVIAYGEILWDIYLDNSQQVLGGAPTNFACRMAEQGFDVQIISRVGDDELGRAALKILEEKGVDITLVQVDPDLPTGTVPITLQDGEPSYEIVEGVAYDEISLTSEIIRAVGLAELIYFGTLAQRSPASESTLKEMIKIAPRSTLRFSDLNLRRDCYTSEALSYTIGASDIVKLNNEELAVFAAGEGLGGDSHTDIVERLFALHSRPRLCVVSLGADGVSAWEREGKELEVPCFPSKIVDTVGAGDALSAGVAGAIMRGEDTLQALLMGSALAALTVSSPGATSPIRDEDLHRLLYDRRLDFGEGIEVDRYGREENISCELPR